MSEILWVLLPKRRLATIKETYLKSSYLLDTHTAVGMKVYQQYVVETGDKQ